MIVLEKIALLLSLFVFCQILFMKNVKSNWKGKMSQRTIPLGGVEETHATYKLPLIRKLPVTSYPFSVKQARLFF